MTSVFGSLRLIRGSVFKPCRPLDPHEGGQYATEDRQVRDSDRKLSKAPTVLLDSVQSQANRMELPLLKALDAQKIQMPLLAIDFGADTSDLVLMEVGRLTAFEAPHRMCDAIFRDSVLGDVPFRQSALGNELNSAKSTNATPVLKICPLALVFGFRDSAGPRGGLGAKAQRALVPEIVGYECEPGKRPASRIDPLQIQNNVDHARGREKERVSRKAGKLTLDRTGHNQLI